MLLQLKNQGIQMMLTTKKLDNVANN